MLDGHARAGQSHEEIPCRFPARHYLRPIETIYNYHSCNRSSIQQSRCEITVQKSCLRQRQSLFPLTTIFTPPVGCFEDWATPDIWQTCGGDGCYWSRPRECYPAGAFEIQGAIVLSEPVVVADIVSSFAWFQRWLQRIWTLYYRVRSRSTLTACNGDFRRFTHSGWVAVVEDIFFERMSSWRKRYIVGIVRAYRTRTHIFTVRSNSNLQEVSEGTSLLHKQDLADSLTIDGTMSREIALDAALDELTQRSTASREWLKRLRR